MATVSVSVTPLPPQTNLRVYFTPEELEVMLDNARKGGASGAAIEISKSKTKVRIITS